jgi:type II secretory pathway pseudopilin PulG
MQAGATLVVSMIMLLILTLLVVSAIRSSTTNLRIAGNMQVQGEVAAAAQQAVEQVIDGDFTTVPSEQNIPVSMGVADYTVNVTKPTCSNTEPVALDELKKDDANDQLCFGDSDPLPVVDSSGKQITTPSKCNKQVWEVRASVTDSNTGANTSVVQGVAKRTYVPTDC